MEVLYLDTQKKLSDLQTEFRAKMEEHDYEVKSIHSTLRKELEVESYNNKRLVKELVNLFSTFITFFYRFSKSN